MFRFKNHWFGIVNVSTVNYTEREIVPSRFDWTIRSHLIRPDNITDM